MARGASIFLTFALGCAAVGGPDPSLAQPPSAGQASFSALPKPTGPYSVGTTSFHLTDPSRPEPSVESGDVRQVEIIAWYPAVSASAGAAAPYLRGGLEEARTFAALMQQPETAFDYLTSVRTWSTLDAAPRVGDRFPVLLFSHGYTAVASSYTALLEDLASHGYAVLSVVHPYEAVVSTLGDGRRVSMLDDRSQIRRGIRDILGEWGREDESMADVTQASSDAERLRLMRSYLASLPLTEAMLKRWVDDTALVLDRIPALASGPASHMASHLDLLRVGAFGHSMGGVSAVQFCLEDRRCRAVLNLDGIPQYGPMVDRTLTRPLLMVYSARPGRLGASDVVYRRAARAYERVDVADTLHLAFSDMVLWGGPLTGRPVFGTLEPARAVAITRQIVREFFDRELRGRPAPLLTGRSRSPGITVSRPTSR